MADSGAGEDGFLMTSGLKNASKCRGCAKTLDIGTPAWFNKEGEPGRKVTCQECHVRKFGEAPAEAAVGAKDVSENALTKVKKVRKLAPKYDHTLLLDRDKGLTSVYRNFQKIKFGGKGHEAADLRKLLGKYAEWAHILVPNMEFTDFIERLEKGANMRVRSKLENIRNVQQGMCSLEEIDDYELADKVERHPGADAHGSGGRGLGELDDDEGLVIDGLGDEWDDDFDEPIAAGARGQPQPTAAASVSEEQRERMERNRQLALERAAQRKAAGAAGAPPAAETAGPTADDEDMEWAWEEAAAAERPPPQPRAAEQAAARAAATTIEEEEEEAFGGFDEEAEMTLFGDMPMATPPPPAAASGSKRTAAQAGVDRSEEALAEAEIEAEIEAERQALASAGASVPGAEASLSQPPEEFTFRDPIDDIDDAAGDVAGEPAGRVAEASEPAGDGGASGEALEDEEETAAAREAAARAKAQADADALEAGLLDDL